MPSDLEKIGLQAVLDLAAEWTKNVAQYNRDVQDMQQETEKTAEKTAAATEKQTKRQEQALSKVGLAFTAAGVAGLALLTSITMTASRTEELGVILDVTAINAQRMAEANEDWAKASALTADAVDAQVAAVKDLGITTQAASQLVAQMIRFNLDWTRSTELAALAQDAATFAAQDSSDAVQGLIHGITTLNPRVLRQYGILINLNQEYSKFADTTGRTTESITDAEKQTIAFNAVLAQAPAIAGAYEAAMDTASKQIRSLSRDTTEVAEAFGKHLTPALAGGVGALRNLLKWLRDLPDPVQATAVQIGIAAAGLSSFVGAAALVIPKVQGLIKAFKGLSIVSNLASAGLLGPVGLVAGLAAVAAAAVIYAREVEKANREAAASVLETSESYEEYTRDAEGAELGSYALSEGLYEVAKASQAAGAGITALDLIEAQREMENLLLVIETGIGPLDDLLQAVQESDTGIEVFKNTIQDLIPDATDAQLAILADAESIRELGERAGLAGPELDDLVTSIVSQAKEAERGRKTAAGLVEAEAAIEREAKKAAEALDEMGDGMTAAERRSAKLTEKLIDQRLETQALTAAEREYADVAEDLVTEAAEKMADAEEKAGEQREKARAELLDAQEDLEEEHTETVEDLLQEVADVDKKLKADRLKAEEEYQKARDEAADDAHAAILAAEAELSQKQQDAWQDLQDKLKDIKREGNEEIEDLDRDLGRDLNELTIELAAEQEIVWAEYYVALENLATAHGEKVNSITESYAQKREAIEAKFRIEPEPETTDDLRERLQEELRLIQEQREKEHGIASQREQEVIQQLADLKAQELAALEEAQQAELEAEDAAYDEQQALAEQRRDEALDAEQQEYEARKAQRLTQYDEALEDLEIAQERERDAAKRDYEQKDADLKAALTREKDAIEARKQERLDSLDDQLEQERARLEQAAAAEKGRLQAQLEEERANYTEREQALQDHYDEQIQTIDDSVAEEQEAITQGLAEELRVTIEGLGKKSEAFREAYANELDDLDAYLAERLARERQYQQELEAMFGIGSPSKWMEDLGKDLRRGFDIGLGDDFAADLIDQLANVQMEVGEFEAPAITANVQAEAASAQAAPGTATDLIGALGAFQGGLGSLASPVIQPAGLPVPQMASTTSISENVNVELTANYARQQSEASLRDDASLLMMQLRSMPRRTR